MVLVNIHAVPGEHAEPRRHRHFERHKVQQDDAAHNGLLALEHVAVHLGGVLHLGKVDQELARQQ